MYLTIENGDIPASYVSLPEAVCFVSPLFGEDEPILTHSFSRGLVQPPTS